MTKSYICPFQLSYQPLGSLNGGTPVSLNLGVAILLVCLWYRLLPAFA